MKIIKYRVWDGSQMHYGNSLLWGDTLITEAANNGGLIEYDDLVSGQVSEFTGLKDKNGVECFESDLIKTKDGVIWLIAWNEEKGQFELQWKGGKQPEYYRFGLRLIKDCQGEVIGNNYQIPA